MINVKLRIKSLQLDPRIRKIWVCLRTIIDGLFIKSGAQAHPTKPARGLFKLIVAFC